MEKISAWFIYFIIYAFLGYLCEVVYVSVGTRRLTNRGYLYGPICPIYGCGAVIVLLSLDWAYDMWYVVLPLGFLLTTTLEYIVSYLMEMIFHMRWWDYSKRKFNINGRVCLLNSTLFAGLVMLLVYVIHPYLVRPLVKLIPSEAILYTIFGILLTIFIIDTIISTIKNIDKAKLILKLQNTILDLESKRIERISNLDEKILLRVKKIAMSYPSLRLHSKLKMARISLHELIEKIENKRKEE